jgi:Uma2 family endonuclease
MSTATSGLMKADELFAMPGHGSGYELVRGELRRKGEAHTLSPAGFRHGAIIARLTGALVQHIEANELGEATGAETGFKLASNPDTVRAPDLAFVRRELIPEGDLTEKFWPGAPDLAVEVVSPGDTLYEVDEKIEDYLKAGVRMVWIVNPKKRTVTVYRPEAEALTLTEDDVLDGEDVVSGFQYSIARLFARKPSA